MFKDLRLWIVLSSLTLWSSLSVDILLFPQPANMHTSELCNRAMKAASESLCKANWNTSKKNMFITKIKPKIKLGKENGGDL